MNIKTLISKMLPETKKFMEIYVTLKDGDSSWAYQLSVVEDAADESFIVTRETAEMGEDHQVVYKRPNDEDEDEFDEEIGELGLRWHPNLVVIRNALRRLANSLSRWGYMDASSILDDPDMPDGGPTTTEVNDLREKYMLAYYDWCALCTEAVHKTTEYDEAFNQFIDAHKALISAMRVTK